MAVIKCWNRTSYTSSFGNRRYRPPIAAIYEVPVLSYRNRVSYTSSF